MPRPSLKMQIRFEPTRLAQEHLRVAFELVAPICRRPTRVITAQTSELGLPIAAPRVERAEKDQTS